MIKATEAMKWDVSPLNLSGQAVEVLIHFLF